MDEKDQERLAQIRAQQAKWEAINPEAATWDTAFLLRLLDQKKENYEQKTG